MAQRRERHIIIIGSGFGGLGLGIRLKHAGIHSFTILEQAETLGGTWRDNAYPGAACDVPSMLYCFSFDQKTDWSRKWSSQAEIQEYLQDSARRHGLLPHIRFRTQVTGAQFDEATGTWAVSTAHGETLTADVLVAGVGQLHQPAIPEIPGANEFRGVAFHSARWPQETDLTGKRVAVIGNAASAIQFIPQIARQVESLLIFQRSANWMIPRRDRAYRAWEHRLFATVPGVARLYRAWIYWLQETLFLPIMKRKRWATWLYTRGALQFMRTVITDPALRTALTPDYVIGAKRVLISDDYYPALRRKNVQLITTGIERLAADGVVTRDGTLHPVDTVVYATGFRTNPFLASLAIEGPGGRRLADDWAHGAKAYYGMTVAGYPNFFMLYGPNTNLGHNSIVFMLECQFAYIMSALRLIAARDLRSVDVRPEVMTAFNDNIQAALARTAWAAVGASWYKDAEGHITNNWPYSTVRYWWRTRRLHEREYRLEARSAVPQVAGTGAADATGAAGEAHDLPVAASG